MTGLLFPQIPNSNGRRRATRNSPISFAMRTVSQYSWRQRGEEAESFLIVTATAEKGLVDIHDHRPLILSLGTACEWIRQDMDEKEAEEIVTTVQYQHMSSVGTLYRPPSVMWRLRSVVNQSVWLIYWVVVKFPGSCFINDIYHHTEYIDGTTAVESAPPP